jgi:DHA1 family bicyclomycin/chloramphenicol resistance-like MFS transporter
MSRGIDIASLGRGRRLGIITILGALSAFGPLSMDVYLPSLPDLGRDLHASDSVAQLTVSMCMVGLALGQVLAGPLSDRLGRRRPLTLGVAVYAVTSLLCALAPGIWSLIGLRLLQGLAGAAGLVVARAMVRDLFSGDQAARAFSTLMVITGLAPVLAPLAGGQLARFTDWRGMFVALAIMGLLLLGAAFLLPETLPPAARHTGGLRTVGAQFATLTRDRRYLGYALVLAVGSCALFSYISLGSFVLRDGYGMSAQLYSMVFSANALGIVLASNLNRVAVARAGSRRLLFAGVVTTLTGGVVSFGSVLTGLGLAGLLPGLFLIVASGGITMPNATALAMDRHGERAGSASALIGMLQFLSGAIVPPLVSTAGAGALAMTLPCLVACAAALLLLTTLTSARATATTRAAPADVPLPPEEPGIPADP